MGLVFLSWPSAVRIRTRMMAAMMDGRDIVGHALRRGLSRFVENGCELLHFVLTPVPEVVFFGRVVCEVVELARAAGDGALAAGRGPATRAEGFVDELPRAFADGEDAVA
jgi:hypothetical protein